METKSAMTSSILAADRIFEMVSGVITKENFFSAKVTKIG
jgi:hypothetical protein